MLSPKNQFYIFYFFGINKAVINFFHGSEKMQLASLLPTATKRVRQVHQDANKLDIFL